MAAIDPKAKLVSASGTATSSAVNLPGALLIAAFVQDAAIKATEDAMAEGISDPDIIRERKIAAMSQARTGIDARIAEAMIDKG